MSTETHETSFEDNLSTARALLDEIEKAKRSGEGHPRGFYMAAFEDKPKTLAVSSVACDCSIMQVSYALADLLMDDLPDEPIELITLRFSQLLYQIMKQKRGGTDTAKAINELGGT